MAESPEPYDIDANDKPEVPAPAGGGGGGAGAPEKPRLFDIPLPPAASDGGAGKPGKGKIDAPKLLDGFEEDADFDKDPEVDRAILGKDKRSQPIQPGAEKESFVQPGLGGPKVWLVVGTVLLVTGLIATGVNAEQNQFVKIILLLYNTLLHTGTGVVALFIAATLQKKNLGSFELAASRMFAAVAAFAMMSAFKLHLFSYQGLNSTVVLFFAAAAYGILVATLFGLWKREPLGYVVGAHFGLWLIVAVGSLMAVVAQSTPVPKSATPAPKPTPAAQSPATPPK